MLANLFSRIFFDAHTDIFLWQYYYAHANKNFNTDGAKHFEGDGKIYGGDPVLIRTESQVEVQAQAAAQQTV